ncbi:pilin [Patescibacteria group bacterium]|nr:pilin [Patescibacteria group bacterium]
MKKFLRLITEVATVTALMLFFLNISYASTLPLNFPEAGSGEEEPVDSVSQIYREAGVPVPEGEGAIVDNLFEGALSYARIIIGAIGILFITIMGLKMIMSGGDEEELTKAKRSATYLLIAFVMVSMGDELARMLDFSDGGLFQGDKIDKGNIRIFERQVELFVMFIKYIVGSYATIMLIRSALSLVTSGGEEETVTEEKKTIAYSGAGLVLLYMGDIFIKKVFFIVKEDRFTGMEGVEVAVNTIKGNQEIIGITNFIVSLVGPLAVLLLIVAAILYATSGGNEEQMDQAKRIVFTTVIAIAIIYGAFAFVSTILVGRFETAAQLTGA